jgi:hypothetical protein
MPKIGTLIDPFWEVKDALKSWVTHKASLPIPSVYVMNEKALASPNLWSKHPLRKGDYLRASYAQEYGLPKLDGLEVLTNLAGEMERTDETVLRHDVMSIFAARMGLLAIEEDHPQDQAEGVAVSVRFVPPDDLTPDELNRFMVSMAQYGDLHPVTFSVLDSEKVRAYLARRNERRSR